jgi:hypothetical protein
MDGDQDDIVLNPVVIAEVLSEATQRLPISKAWTQLYNLRR